MSVLQSQQEQVPQKAEEQVPDNSETTTKDALSDMEQRLAALQSQVDEHLEQWRRTAAEFANYKKRQERDRSQFMKYANAGLITRLLPVLDDLHRALETTPDHLTEQTWIEGIILIERKLWSILEQEGVTKIQADRGQSFDPSIHEALTWEETAEVPDGHIIDQVQQGYKLHDRVLRPSLVRVGKGMPAPVEEKDEHTSQTTQGDH